jgi:hypothetical protein
LNFFEQSAPNQAWYFAINFIFTFANRNTGANLTKEVLNSNWNPALRNAIPNERKKSLENGKCADTASLARY